MMSVSHYHKHLKGYFSIDITTTLPIASPLDHNAVGWIGIIFDKHIHATLSMHPVNCGDLMFFPLAPPSSQTSYSIQYTFKYSGWIAMKFAGWTTASQRMNPFFVSLCLSQSRYVLKTLYKIIYSRSRKEESCQIW